MRKKILIATAGFLVTYGSIAHGFFTSYIVDYLRGPGSYTLANGSVGEGKLSFRTRGETTLYVGNNLQFSAKEVRSFTIDSHTLVPAGNFDFEFGVHSYHAENTFIEYADTSGYLQLALFHTAEPIGSTTVSFATYLLRRRGDKEFISGPNAFKKWSKDDRQDLAEELSRWPELQQAVKSGTATFENFPEYVRRANQAGH
ncbi:hypothetical protein [Hymenobacter siberiensis]|jgi:hypothetical protein|uniref:hypothetical protein n=1 Tax=Hymenobacter siberiensis TaxID=2848396 RepID=UPI001C1E73C2|nr:hypothetical protein [Hymenobacter siberiensis]MBU6121172.1 hypothetical protein [Hymenobacter siberiensis]